MKTILLSATMLLISVASVLGQKPVHETTKLNLEPEKIEHSSHRVLQVPNQSGQKSHSSYFELLRDSGTILFQEDFADSIPGGWTQSGNNVCSWAWSTQGSQGQYAGGGPAIDSPTASNGFAILDADNCNPGNQQNFTDITQGLQHVYNLSGKDKAVIVFKHYFRPFGNGELYFMASKDSVSWVEWDVRGTVPSNTSSDNALTEKFILDGADPLLGNNFGQLTSTTYIKFEWRNGSHYHWQVDDIIICELPDNDLVLNESYFNGVADTTFHTFYTQAPLRQAEANGFIHFGGAIENIGGQSQSGTQISANVTQVGGAPFNSSSSSIVLATTAHDSIDVANTYSVTTGNVGNYETTLTLSSSSTDAFPFDNVLEHDFEVTNTTFAYDIDNAGGGIIYGQGQVYTVMLGFDLLVGDTVCGMWYQCFRDDQQGVGTSVNGVLNFSLLDSNFALVANDSKKDFVTLTQANMNVWNFVQFDNPLIPVNPGRYYVAVATINGADEYWMAVKDVDEDENDPFNAQKAYIDVGNDGVDGFINFTPFLRLCTKSKTNLCAGVNINLAITDDYNWDNVANEIRGTLEVSFSGNGSPPYTFMWEGPGIVGDDDLATIEVNANGNYCVTVTDQNFCTATLCLEVTNISTGINEVQETKLDLQIYPNPSDGLFRISSGNELSDAVDLKVFSIHGATVYIGNSTINNGNERLLDLSYLEPGIYLFEARSSEGNYRSRLLIE